MTASCYTLRTESLLFPSRLFSFHRFSPSLPPKFRELLGDVEVIPAGGRESGALGYALDRGEESETFACVSAPIFDHRGQPVAAIWISGPSDRVTPANLEKLGAKVKQFAEQLSQRLA